MKTNVLRYLEERINTVEKLAQDSLKNNDGINSAIHNAIAAELKAVKDYVEGLEDNEELLSTTQAAEEIGLNTDAVGIKQVNRYIERGWLKATKAGRSYICRRSDVEKFKKKYINDKN